MCRCRAFLVLAAVAAASACAQPLEFADWVIPLPEGTPVFEYPPTPMEGRAKRIELVEDLVIGGEGGEATFYQPADLAVATDGRIYVADAGKHRVEAFDGAGRLLLSMGRQGEGPGEFQGPRLLAIAGGLLVVYDNERFSTWTLDGARVANFPSQLRRTLLELEGADSESVIGLYDAGRTVDARADVLGRFTTDGRELLEYASLERVGDEVYDESTSAWLWMVQAMVNNAKGPALGFAVDRSGRLYVSPKSEYQLSRLSLSGEVEWALRVAWPRAPYGDELVQRDMRTLRQRLPEATGSAIDWPDRQRAVEMLRVDGHGHVYVFPIVPESADGAREELPVDVYAPDGEHVFSGLIARTWSEALGDHVFGFRTAPASGEREVVRYRLVEPF